MTLHDRKHIMRRKLLVFGATALAVAAIGSVAIAPGLPSGVAAESTLVPVDTNPGQLIRSNVGVTTGQYGTVASTYVVVGPGGVIYGPDGSPIPQETPVTYVNGVVGGTPSSGGPQFTISTPTAVIYQGQSSPSTTTGQTGTTPPQQHFIGSLDGPPPSYAPLTAATPTSQNVITGQVNPQATIDPANNPNVIVGTSTGGTNSMGVVQGNGRGA